MLGYVYSLMIVANRKDGTICWLDDNGRLNVEGRSHGILALCAFIRGGQLHFMAVGWSIMYVYGEGGYIYEVNQSGDRVRRSAFSCDFSLAKFQQKSADECVYAFSINADIRHVITFAGDKWSHAIDKNMRTDYHFNDGERVWNGTLSGLRGDYVCSDPRYNFTIPYPPGTYGIDCHDARSGLLLLVIDAWHIIDSIQYDTQLVIICTLTKSIVWTMHITRRNTVRYALFASDNVIMLSKYSAVDTTMRHYAINTADGTEYEIA